MTTEEAAFRGILYGGAFTLAGTLVANCFQILIQWLQQKWSLTTEKKKDFMLKRLGALQGAVQLCDFVVALKGKRFGPAAKEDWVRIRRENLANGALMPESIQKDFQTVLTSIVIIDDFAFVEAAVEIEAIERLRASCLEALQKEYEK